jgi:antitoxin (DNA-binding transcriptional repressor) of toxin-antitoxin stability system
LEYFPMVISAPARNWGLKAGGELSYCGPVKTMTVSEAKSGFDRLLRWVAGGEEVEITQHKQAVARVVPLRTSAANSLAGSVLEEGDLVSPTGARWEAAS